MSAPADKVLRVVCASLSLVRSSVMEELLAMRQQVCAFNAANGLRMAYLYSSGWFFQWIEGPVAGVEKALHVSQADPRHHRPRVLHRSLGERTLTETLQIATTHGVDKPTDVARRLHHLLKGQDMEPHAHPGELWQHLAAPLYLPTGAQAPALARRHVVAITSEYTGAVDLVRMFSERFSLPMTYQRFAMDSPQSADVGAAYVDLPGASQVTRLHALSRRSLAHPMVRLMLKELNCVVMLLGERTDAACALADDVGSLVRGLAVRPALRLAAGGQDSVNRARERLQTYGGDIAEIDAGVLWQTAPEGLFGSLISANDTQAGELDLLLA